MDQLNLEVRSLSLFKSTQLEYDTEKKKPRTSMEKKMVTFTQFIAIASGLSFMI